MKEQQIAKRQRPKEFYLDGLGARHYNRRSGFAWLRTDTPSRHVVWREELTVHQATYLALLSVLRHLPTGSHAVIFTHSQLVAFQFCGRYGAYNTTLKRLLRKAKERISEKELEIEVRWVPRDENRAGGLLERLDEYGV